MQKRKLLVPTLSAVILSAAVLSQKGYADEVEQSAPTNGREVAASQVVVTRAEQQTITEKSSTQQSPLATSEEQEVENERIDENQGQTSPSEMEEQQVTAPAEPQEVTATDTATAASKSSSEDITIIHTNDVHGRMVEDENNGVIGDAKLASIVKESRAKGETLVFDAGDVFQGLPITNSSKGEDMADILNAIGYDAMTLGNHEFDFGLNQLKRLREKLTFPIISSNVYVDGARLFEPSTIIDKNPDVKGDEFVVIGVTTPETATKTHPNNVVGVTFTDPITEVTNVIAQTEATARAQGEDYHNYVILAHLGVDATTKTEWQGTTLAKALAENELLKDKNVIVIDGHSHTVLQVTNGNVTYNQTGSYLNNVGLIKLNAKEVLSAGVITAEQAKTITPDSTVANLVDAIKTKYQAQNAEVVRDNNPVEFNGDRMNVRVRQTNLGDLVADALLNYGQTGFSHKSNLAVTNGGGLRETLKKDQPITKGDIIAVLPFGNSVAQIQVTGQNIYDMFAKSLGSITQKDQNNQVVLDDNKNPLLEPSGGFLQVAGARVYYDANLPAEKRILAINIWDPETDTCKPLDLKQTYYLTTNDFLAAGGDDYTMLGGPREEGPSMDQVLEDYLKSGVDLSKYEAVNANNRLISTNAVTYFRPFKSPILNMVTLTHNKLLVNSVKKIIDDWEYKTEKRLVNVKPVEAVDEAMPLFPLVSPEEISEQETSQQDEAKTEEQTGLSEAPGMEKSKKTAPMAGTDKNASVSNSSSSSSDSPSLAQSSADTSGVDTSSSALSSSSSHLAASSQGLGMSTSSSPQGHFNEILVSVIGLAVISAGALFDHFRPRLRKPK